MTDFDFNTDPNGNTNCNTDFNTDPNTKRNTDIHIYFITDFNINYTQFLLHILIQIQFGLFAFNLI